MMFELIAGVLISLVSGPTLEWVGSVPALGSVGELKIGTLTTSGNPFDPSVNDIRCEVTAPNGSVSIVPAFYYQPMARSLSGSSESITSQGSPQWRIRISPTVPGKYEVLAKVTVLGSTLSTNKLSFVPKRLSYQGFVQKSVSSPLALTYQNGSSFTAVGENLAWPGSRGTFDYDMWIPSLRESGINYVRLWCCPWYFGFEVAPNQLLNYSQRPLWALDYVMQQLKEAGIGVILCIDYHGMLESTPDYWGGNNNWLINPYNSVNGGPAANPNEFFTKPNAKDTYKKRLRYLIGRYSAYSNLVAWEFWNEIDNVIGYLNKPDVVAWHTEMAAFLKANDPYQHLVTTSLSGSWWPELWSIGNLDFSQIHNYGQSSPGKELPNSLKTYSTTLGKPVIVGEYGVDWRGYGAEQDPYHRGLHQALWGSLVSTAFGTAQSWWWENIHTDNLYSHLKSVRTVVDQVERDGNWSSLVVDTPGLDTVLGDLDPNGTAFQATLVPNGQWGAILSGQALLRDDLTSGCDSKNITAFVHGSYHSDLRIPLKIIGHFDKEATMTLHLNSVSNECKMAVKVNGSQVFYRAIPNKDGQYAVNNEYNEDITIPLPAGRNVIEISNPGGDWFYYDWLKFTQVRPAKRVGAGVPLEAVGVGSTTDAWVWLLDFAANYPNNAVRQTIPSLQNAEATINGLKDGTYDVLWFDTRSGAFMRLDRPSCNSGKMKLTPPSLSEDIFASIQPEGKRIISGRLNPVDWSDLRSVLSQATAQVLQKGTSTVLATVPISLDAVGNFKFVLPVVPGQYDLRFKMSHWLSAKVSVDASVLSVRNLVLNLENGDIFGDNAINALDWNALCSAWRTVPVDAKWNENADLNGDGRVDALDFNILSKNWRHQGY